MAIKKYRPATAGLRSKASVVKELSLRHPSPARQLSFGFKRSRGRSHGRVTVRHKGGGARRLYRRIDFIRNNFGLKARVRSIEYDPNRGAYLALVVDRGGTYRYILSPQGLKVGDSVESGEKVEIRIGNALPLKSIPLGTFVHNIEIYPGRGGQLVRGAGTYGEVLAREESGSYIQVRLPSGEVRRFLSNCRATIGQLSNLDRKNVNLGKAGLHRHLGVRPTVRGVAQNPRSHPHGGGEGKSGVGLKSAKTPWGKKALGKKTRRRSATDKYLLKRRRP